MTAAALPTAPDAARKHLYLVDGSGYIFRAYHRLPPLTDPDGTPVGAVYGYTTMLWKLAKDLHEADGPTHLAVILDHSSVSFRNELYGEYKANRPPPPEDLVPQFPLIRDATRAFSLPCIEMEGFEADDLIASYATAARAAGWDVTIVSSDKDLMQLIEDHGADKPGVDLLDTMKNQRLGREAVIEKFGVGPERLGDVLALMGDSVDNVPGVTGVGPKTAAKLINEHGDLTAVLAAAPSMKAGKLRDNLIAEADLARLSRVLVELKSDVPLPMPLDDLVLDAIPPDPLRTFLVKHGFRSLAAKLDGNRPPPGPSPLRADMMGRPGLNTDAAATVATAPQAIPDDAPLDRAAIAVITDASALDALIARAHAAHAVGIDFATSATDSTGGRIVGIALSTGAGQTAYIPVGHGGGDLLGDGPVQVDAALVRDRLSPLLHNDAVTKVSGNAKGAITAASLWDIRLAPHDDVSVMSFNLDAGRGAHGIDDLAARMLNHTAMTAKELRGTGKSLIAVADVTVPTAAAYFGERAELALRIWRRLQPRMVTESATRVYERVDRPLLPALSLMERAGILVNQPYLAKLSGEFATEMARIEADIHADAGQTFAIGSPKQLGEILFDTLGLKGGRKGKSGDWSTDQRELERLERDGVGIARKVLEWRQLNKLQNTYTEALQAAINPDTGRVHTTYILTAAQTGRLSASEPNLQNIPIRTELGRQIRHAFIAPEGSKIIAADYGQIELRLAADMADVPEMKEAFRNGDDIHAATAEELFGESNRDTRGVAKMVNFSILYGISRWGLAQRLEKTPDEAQAIITRYFERFPGVSAYMQTQLEAARDKGYVETLFGRRTWFPSIDARNQGERQNAERAAINAPIQGTSADIIKRAMARMPKALADAGLDGVKMLLSVHDELVFEAPDDLVEAAIPVIRDIMAHAHAPMVTLSVPLEVGIGVGQSWGDAH